MVKRQGSKNIKLVCLVGAPEGVAAVEKAHPDVDIYLASLDDHLNEKGCIVRTGGCRRSYFRYEVDETFSVFGSVFSKFIIKYICRLSDRLSIADYTCFYSYRVILQHYRIYLSVDS